MRHATINYFMSVLRLLFKVLSLVCIFGVQNEVIIENLDRLTKSVQGMSLFLKLLLQYNLIYLSKMGLRCTIMYMARKSCRTRNRDELAVQHQLLVVLGRLLQVILVSSEQLLLQLLLALQNRSLLKRKRDDMVCSRIDKFKRELVIRTLGLRMGCRSLVSSVRL